MGRTLELAGGGSAAGSTQWTGVSASSSARVRASAMASLHDELLRLCDANRVAHMQSNKDLGCLQF